MKKGTKVNIVAPVLAGEVVEQRIVEDEAESLISYVGADGEKHQRWYKDGDPAIQVTEAA